MNGKSMRSRKRSRMPKLLASILVMILTPGLAIIASPASAAGDPPGNNGTVKIDGVEFDSHPDNQPHVGCTFQVDFYGFDAGVGNATVTFALQSPTSAGRTLTVTSGDLTPDIGQDAAGGGTDVDAQETYTLAFTGAPHPQQGYHVKLTVNAPGSQGSDTKFKTFWVEGCNPPQSEPGTATATPGACVDKNDSDGTVVVTVSNTDDATNQTVTYTVTLNGVTKTVTVADGASGSVTYTGLAPGTYNWSVTGNDGTNISKTVTVAECPPEDETFVPTRPTKVDKCEPQRGTNDRVFIPEDAYFTYLLNGELAAPGPHKASKTRYVVKAVPNLGVSVEEGVKTRWVFEFSKKACFVPNEVRGAVKSVDKCRTSGDRYAVKPHKGIVYFVNGERIRENVWLRTHGDRRVVVKAKAASPKYKLVGKDRWVLRFDNRPCGTPDIPPDSGA